jgi:hypothetical protein
MSLADAAAGRLLNLDRADASGNLDNGGLHAYWRKPDGWITIGGMGAHEVQAALESEWQLLMPYGKFPLVPSQKGGWEPHFDPYFLILSLGGIKDFSLEQIEGHRWHLRPHPVLAAEIKKLTDGGVEAREALNSVIPQLRGQAWQAEFCTYCPERIFNDKTQLSNHEIIHKAEKGQRQMGETIAEALAAAQVGNTAALTPLLTQLAQSQQALTVLVEQLMKDRVPTVAPSPIVTEMAVDEPSARKGK